MRGVAPDLLSVLAVAMLAWTGRGVAAEAPEPCNPAASADARRLLGYLASLKDRPDHRVISGQMAVQPGIDDGYKLYVEQLAQQTGRWVGLAGADYAFPDTPNPKTIARFNRILVEHWKAGGLVTVSAHIGNPWGGNAYTRTVGNFDELLTPGNPAYERWMGHWKAIGDGLAELRDQGVVVLWRPFHEMNGNWFWWHNTPEQFSRIWRFVFDYLTKTRGLDNLLWVFAPNEGLNAASYFPGKDRCDIVGLDYYGTSFDVPDYTEMVALGKPFGFTEWGVNAQGRGADGSFDLTRLVGAIRTKFPATCFFLTWGSWRDAKIALVDNQKASELLHDPWILTRAELDWRGASPHAAPGIAP